MNLSVERVVALLTPLFAAISAALTGWVGTHFPGLPQLNPGDVTALQLAGATAGAGAALKWLHGRQQFTRSLTALDALIKSEVSKATADQQAGPALEDIAGLLEQHTGQIVQAVATAVHAPPSAAEVLDELLDRAAQAKPPGSPLPLTTPEQAAASTVTASPTGPGPVSA